MRWNHLCAIMPALVAGIHVLPPPYPPPQAGEGREGAARKMWMAGTSPAMTPNKWFNMTGIGFSRAIP